MNAMKKPLLLSDEDFRLTERIMEECQKPHERSDEMVKLIEFASPQAARLEYLRYSIEMQERFMYNKLIALDKYREELAERGAKSTFSSTIFNEVMLFKYDETRGAAEAIKYIDMALGVIDKRIMACQTVIKFFQKPVTY